MLNYGIHVQKICPKISFFSENLVNKEKIQEIVHNNKNDKIKNNNDKRIYSKKIISIYCEYGPVCINKDTTCKKKHNKELILEHDPMCSYGLKCKYINSTCIRYHTIPELIRNMKQNTNKIDNELNELKESIKTLKQKNIKKIETKNISCKKIQFDNLKVSGLKELCNLRVIIVKII